MHVWLVVLALVLSTLLPGLVISCFFLKSANPTTKLTASPMIGLFCLFLITGFVQLIGLYSPLLVAILALAINFSSVMYLLNSEKNFKSFFMEIYTAHFSEKQNRFFSIAFIILSIFTLSPIFLLDIPYGVDWIGFSNLLVALNQTGSLNFMEPNYGNWIYPPGFISTAGILSIFPNVQEFEALLILGFYSLFTIILGVFAVGEKYNAGIFCGLMMFLGVGIFAKSFDSGWPTVASQIPVLIGLLILQESDFTIDISNRFKLLLTVLGALIIHPTGAISLFILIFVVVFLQRDKVSNKEYKVVFVGLICLIFVISNLLSSNLSNLEQFSEYGWQGGFVLIKYNAPLCLIALYYGIRQHKNSTINTMSKWLFLVWLLSFVHLLPILEELPATKLLGYLCYSMGLHMFHIPFSLIAGTGLMLSLQSIQTQVDSNLNFTKFLSKQAISLLLVCCFLLPIGIHVLAQTAENKHHFATTESTLELIDQVNTMEISSIVYTENSHWGYLQIEEIRFRTTSIPRLGLMVEQNYVQSEATRAILSNDFETLRNLEIEYAITSPMGSLQYSLIESGSWITILDIDGSRLWKLDSESSNANIQAFAFNETNCSQNDCQKVKDLWRDYRYNDQLELGKNRLKLTGEGGIDVPLNLANQSGKACILYEVRGKVDEFNVNFLSYNSSFRTALNTSPGWHLDCEETVVFDLIELQFDVQISNDRGFANPSGFSGRSEYLFEKPGVVLHHFEFHNSSA